MLTSEGDGKTDSANDIYSNTDRLINSITFNASVGEIYQIPVDGDSGIYMVKLKDANSCVAKTLKLIKK